MKSSLNKQLAVLAEANLNVALEQMRSHCIVMTPENIMIWYHYKQGDMPQLMTELNRLIGREASFTPNLCAQLYHRFFTEVDRRQLDLLREAMRQIITQLMGNLETLSSDVEDYEAVLSDCVDTLQQDPDVSQLQSLVSTLLVKSQQALEQNADAQKKMQCLRTEISQLRHSMQDLERSALEDSLTSVANRRAFDQRFTEHLEDAKNSGRRCCLLLVDIDFFKHFNDQYGHLVGDKALRYVAMMLKDIIKGQDFVARYGGEEFAVLLPNTEYGGALALAESIASRFASTPLTLTGEGGSIDPITVSIGVSSSKRGDTEETLFRRADAGLYKAKDLGRNTVVGEQDL